MRNLTIERKKTFVGCAMKLKVYIEDETAGDLVINGVPCRKLGTVKNGETQAFQIEDKAAKVFVIADTLSKNYCLEFYQLPEGNEDVHLAGKNHLNPLAGNPFRFENNDTPEVQEIRKKGEKMGTIIFVCAIVVGFVVGILLSIAFL